MSDEPESAASPPERADRLDVRGPDRRVAQIQLAARWAEMYTPQHTTGDRPTELLRRYRMLHDYIDAVVHGTEPPPLPE